MTTLAMNGERDPVPPWTEDAANVAATNAFLPDWSFEPLERNSSLHIEDNFGFRSQKDGAGANCRPGRRSRMSHRSAGTRPTLSTIAIPTLRDAGFAPDVRPLGSTSRRIPEVEKNVDDPTISPSGPHVNNGAAMSPPSMLSNLFVVHNSPESSRNPSYLQSARNYFTHARPNSSIEAASLPDHLYTRGLLEGRHSDITVIAFGHRYKLHRLILDRAPFFASALSEPWMESHAQEIAIHPEEMDPSITQASFELALGRLYGLGSSAEEEMNATSLLATGCWLEMHDLVGSAIENILRQMTLENLSTTIRFVTSNFYGCAGDKVLASAKAMLCRHGWKMPLAFWDGVPAEIIREIVGGDGFFVYGEWERWVVAKRILNRRLKTLALINGIIDPDPQNSAQKTSRAANATTIGADNMSPPSKDASTNGFSEPSIPSTSFYTHPDIEPILFLLDEGIHYSHLDFEQLQYVRSARDYLGLPMIPEKVICNALWQQMELRQKVMNAREDNPILGLSEECTNGALSSVTGRSTATSTADLQETPKSKGTSKAVDFGEHDGHEHRPLGNFDRKRRQPRKFWIPNSDCNIVMGGNAEPVVAMFNSTNDHSNVNKTLAMVQQEGVEWPSDLAAATAMPRSFSSGPAAFASTERPVPIRHTRFPPFRFSVEFPNPRHLKDRKRLYSRTVFYAGSFWNLYIQKITSARSKQLGVYLHRVKEQIVEEVMAGTVLTTQGNVDERIGQLEREMMGSNDRHRSRWERRPLVADSDDSEENAMIACDLDGSKQFRASRAAEGCLPGASSSRSKTMQNLIARRSSRRQGLEEFAPESYPHGTTTITNEPHNLIGTTGSSDDSEADGPEAEPLATSAQHIRVPTIPPYVDTRPNLRAYFKIYSPSRYGRMLSVYESVPSDFDFTQSWGWCSSSLMLDEGLLDDDDNCPAAAGTTASADCDDTQDGLRNVHANTTEPKMKIGGDGKLRFVVVIGSI